MLVCVCGVRLRKSVSERVRGNDGHSEFMRDKTNLRAHLQMRFSRVQRHHKDIRTDDPTKNAAKFAGRLSVPDFNCEKVLKVFNKIRIDFATTRKLCRDVRACIFYPCVGWVRVSVWACKNDCVIRERAHPYVPAHNKNNCDNKIIS